MSKSLSSKRYDELVELKSHSEMLILYSDLLEGNSTYWSSEILYRHSKIAAINGSNPRNIFQSDYLHSRYELILNWSSFLLET